MPGIGVPRHGCIRIAVVALFRCMIMRPRAALLVLLVLLLAACSSSGRPVPSSSGPTRIPFGTPPLRIAGMLNVCYNGNTIGRWRARCRFANGDVVLVTSIAGPADQGQAVRTADAIGTFCFLVGHGYELAAVNATVLRKYVRVNDVVARFGGQFAGAC